MKKSGITFLTLIFAILALACFMLSISQVAHRNDWMETTTPLPKETRQLLCKNFELPSDHSLCNGKKDVYALDFVPIIRDTFRPYESYGIPSSDSAVYTDVDAKIGAFKYDCEPVETTGDGLTFFTCNYDLRGDRRFVMTIIYTYPENAVMRIMSTSRYQDD
jgi:hypothetical protein